MSGIRQCEVYSMLSSKMIGKLNQRWLLRFQVVICDEPVEPIGR
jgi:hypothetical protein